MVLDKDAGSWFIGDSSNTVIVSVMVEEKGRQTADKKEGRKPWTLREFGGQTVWDWLHLLSALAIPVVLAAAGLWFTAQQDQRQQQIEGQRAKQAQNIEDQRAEAEQELAEQRAQDEALQAYLNQMSTLMLERKLLEAKPGDPVHTLAQARTSTVILRLDAQHNESVSRFLTDSGLAESSDASPRLLSGIALSHATLSGATLDGADLSGANLWRANLSGAGLNIADLSDANLRGADLSDAFLVEADLSNAYLLDAYLSGAGLNTADLSDAILSHADLSDAFLVEADLSDARLTLADLSGADLIEADLSGAHLWDADLWHTNLSGAKLRDATMPDGQKYQDWLKDKKAREEGG